MADRVLVPFDGSPLSERALHYALQTHPEASITTMYVIDPIESVYAVEAGGLPVSESWDRDAQARAAEIQSTAAAMAAGYDAELETVTVAGKPARKILEHVDELDVDHIVMGSHGRGGLERVVLGSVAETVTRRASVPVTIIR
ncbi:MAG: universal stress protein [Halobacteriales archaeon]|nr:universal stress protein [Halobacteriales archaeon]